MTNFDLAISHVLKMEGGFVEHPADPGGPTNYGITLATLARWRGVPVDSAAVKSLTESEARQIYFELFWTANGLDLLTNSAVATVVFDQVVNRGPGPAIRMLQLALESTTSEAVDVDGVLGPKTATLANRALYRPLVVRLFVEAQRAYLDLWKHRPSTAPFLAGWLARTWTWLSFLH